MYNTCVISPLYYFNEKNEQNQFVIGTVLSLHFVIAVFVFIIITIIFIIIIIIIIIISSSSSSNNSRTYAYIIIVIIIIITCNVKILHLTSNIPIQAIFTKISFSRCCLSLPQVGMYPWMFLTSGGSLITCFSSIPFTDQRGRANCRDLWTW